MKLFKRFKNEDAWSLEKNNLLHLSHLLSVAYSRNKCEVHVDPFISDNPSGDEMKPDYLIFYVKDKDKELNIGINQMGFDLMLESINEMKPYELRNGAKIFHINLLDEKYKIVMSYDLSINVFESEEGSHIIIKFDE